MGGARDECWGRQWRTRMFECLAVAHRVGSPQSERALTWLREVKAHFESSPSNEATWTAYLDNLQSKIGEKEITLDLLQKGPANLGKDEVVAQCVLPLLNNAFPYVPLSLKLSNLEGRIYGANLRKLALQYHQYVFESCLRQVQCSVLAGVQSDIDRSLAGVMIIAVDGAGTSRDLASEDPDDDQREPGEGHGTAAALTWHQAKVLQENLRGPRLPSLQSVLDQKGTSDLR